MAMGIRGGHLWVRWGRQWPWESEVWASLGEVGQEAGWGAARMGRCYRWTLMMIILPFWPSSARFCASVPVEPWLVTIEPFSLLPPPPVVSSLVTLQTSLALSTTMALPPSIAPPSAPGNAYCGPLLPTEPGK